MDLKYIVYITINQCNGKFYIGVHQTNPDTFDGYIGCGIRRLSDACKNFAFHKAVRKYGYENFKRTTLRIFDNKEDAFAFEAQLVTPTVLKSKTCYNCADGGQGGVDPKYYKKVYKFAADGEFLGSFKNARAAAESVREEDPISVMTAIRNNCCGKVKTAYGFVWSYRKEFVSPTGVHWKPVAQYTLYGKFLRSYETIAQAEYLLSTSAISQAVKKGTTACGYYWRYYNGDTSDIKTSPSLYYKNSSIPIIMTHKASGQNKLYDDVNTCVQENPELQAPQINRVLKGIIKSHKGYIFKYQDKDIV